MDAANGVVAHPAETHAYETPDEAEPTPKKLTREERLEVENLYLRVTNLALQEKQLQADLIKCNQMKIEYQKKLEELQNTLGQKYNVDMKSRSVNIDADGNIIQLRQD